MKNHLDTLKKGTLFFAGPKLCILILALLGGLASPPANAEPFRTNDRNSLAGGFGFQAAFSDWVPGGFKWFNEYSRNLSRHVWINLQLNGVFGDRRDRHCWYDERVQHWRCNGQRWDGNAIELAIGPKLRFAVPKIPLVIDAKLAGALETLFFGNNYAGVAIAFRGGVGLHWFLFDNLGFGPELQWTFGPGFISDGVGVEFYGALDFQVIGVEYLF